MLFHVLNRGVRRMELFSKSGKARRSPLSPPSCRRESSARRLLRFAPSWTCISTPAPSSTCERASPYIAAQAPVPYELVDRLLALTTLRVRPHPDFLYEHYRVKLKFNEPLTLFILRNWILVLIGAEMHPPSFPVLEMFLPFNRADYLVDADNQQRVEPTLYDRFPEHRRIRIISEEATRSPVPANRRCGCIGTE